MVTGAISNLILGQINVATAFVRQQADADRQFANFIQEAADHAKTTVSRGQNLNIRV